MPFYRHRAAREQYFRVLSSPRSAGTIFLHFSACSVTASIKIFVFIFAERRCVFGMVGAVPVCPPERPRSGVSIPKIYALCTRIERWMRPCRATWAGTQAPPLPISTKHCGVPLSIVHSIVHTNRTVSLTPSGLYFR